MLILFSCVYFPSIRLHWQHICPNRLPIFDGLKVNSKFWELYPCFCIFLLCKSSSLFIGCPVILPLEHLQSISNNPKFQVISILVLWSFYHSHKYLHVNISDSFAVWRQFEDIGLHTFVKCMWTLFSENTTILWTCVVQYGSP